MGLKERPGRFSVMDILILCMS